MNFNKKGVVMSVLMLINSISLFSQGINTTQITGQIFDLANGIHPVQTAVPFLTIAPNARASGMADQGAATSPDEFSTFWNPGKLAMIKHDRGFGVCYNPWLRKLVNDMSLSYLSGYYRLRKEDVIGVSLTYFDLGSIQFTDVNGANIIQYNPREFAFSGSYSRQLGKGFSAGISLKYIYSNLSGNFSGSTGTQAQPGQAAAADIGFYYNKDIVVANRDFNLAIGTSITNIGNKISYTNSDRADFLPTLIRLGTMVTHELDDFNKISLGVELSKLMVPSSQYQYTLLQKKDGSGDSLDASGNKVATNVSLVNPNKGLVSGMFGSFSDAPGGFSEEMQEINLSVAAEYWYDNVFAVRSGYYYQNPQKGNLNFLSFGLGLRYSMVGLDFSYLLPLVRDHPLANTLRFSLSFNFMKPTKETDSVVE